MVVGLALVECVGICMRVGPGPRATAALPDGAPEAIGRQRRQGPYGGSPGATDGPGGADATGSDEGDAGPEGAAPLSPGLVGRLAGEGLDVCTHAGSLEQVATRLLTSYRDDRVCVLAQAGYLDLLGLVWGCVVEGDGWVDVCVVSECEGGEECQVSVLHMESDEVAGLFGEGGGS